MQEGVVHQVRMVCMVRDSATNEFRGILGFIWSVKGQLNGTIMVMQGVRLSVYGRWAMGLKFDSDRQVVDALYGCKNSDAISGT